MTTLVHTLSILIVELDDELLIVIIGASDGQKLVFKLEIMLNFLPEHILRQIFSYLCHYEDLFSISSVNRKLRCLALDCIENVAFNVGDVPAGGKDVVELLRFIFFRFPRTRRLYLYIIGSYRPFLCSTGDFVSEQVVYLKLGGFRTNTYIFNIIRQLFPNLLQIDLDNSRYDASDDEIHFCFEKMFTLKLPGNTTQYERYTEAFKYSSGCLS